MTVSRPVAPESGDETAQLRLWSLEQVSQTTGMAYMTLVRRCRAGVIEHVQMGRQRRMTTDQVKALIAASVVTAPVRPPDPLEPRIARVQRMLDRKGI
jgi:excisionase family DNA binding protein